MYDLCKSCSIFNLLKLSWSSTGRLHGLFLSLLIPAFHQLVTWFVFSPANCHVYVHIYALLVSLNCMHYWGGSSRHLSGLRSGALHCIELVAGESFLQGRGPRPWSCLRECDVQWLSCSSSIASLVVVVILMSSAAVVLVSNKQQPNDLWRCMLVCIIGLV